MSRKIDTSKELSDEDREYIHSRDASYLLEENQRRLAEATSAEKEALKKKNAPSDLSDMEPEQSPAQPSRQLNRKANRR